MQCGIFLAKSRAAWLILACLVGGNFSLIAEETGLPTGKTTQLIIEPSSTKHSMATCNLLVGPLAFKEECYCGSYEIKVVPFVFKNDHGSLMLAFSATNAAKMFRGEPVEFTGKAVSERDSKVKLIKGKTTPSGTDRGAVAFTVTTEDGDLFFNSTYRFETK